MQWRYFWEKKVCLSYNFRKNKNFINFKKNNNFSIIFKKFFKKIKKTWKVKILWGKIQK